MLLYGFRRVGLVDELTGELALTLFSCVGHWTGCERRARQDLYMDMAHGVYLDFTASVYEKYAWPSHSTFCAVV